VYESRNGAFDLVLDEINTRPFGAVRWAVRSDVLTFIHQVAREVWFHETPWPVALVGRYVLEPRWLRAYANARVFTESLSSVESLRAYGVEDAEVIPMGSDLVLGTPVEKEPTPTFVFVGRLCAMKRPLHAVRALRILQGRHPEARLRIIGAGPEEARVRKAAGDGVEVFGRVTRAERDELLARSHALLVTSVREGWGLVVSEAAAVGTPAVAYATPGLVDSVRATGGVLVPPQPRALADRLAAAAADPASLPVPHSTGTVPWKDVAAALLAGAERGARASS
jgi:glycosyltransferase involved in cell wall biosynthesis